MGVSDTRGCHAVTRCIIMHGGRDGSVTERDAGCRPLSLALGVKGGGECRAHGCRLGADGRGDLTVNRARPQAAPCAVRVLGDSLENRAHT